MFKRFFKYFFLLVVLVCSFFLALSIYAVQVTNPFFWWMGLFALAFPILLIGEMLLFIFSLLFKKWLAIIPLILLILSWPNIQNYIAIPSLEKTEQTGGTELKVLSYNVNVFDLYNWTNNESAKDSILDLIKREDPDVLCLQEFYTENSSKFNTYKVLSNFFPYNHFHRGLELPGQRFWGLATFSKYPLSNQRIIGFTDNKLNLCQVSEAEIDGKKVSIYNMHLNSYHIKEADLNGLNRNHQIQQNLGAAKNLLYKIRGAYQKRMEQVVAIKDDLNQNKNHSIICGDFNDTPNSFPYTHIVSGLKDLFLERGFAIGGTYRGGTITEPFPNVRIDYILCDTLMGVRQFKVLDYPYSDHNPIEAVLVLPD